MTLQAKQLRPVLILALLGGCGGQTSQMPPAANQAESTAEGTAAARSGTKPVHRTGSGSVVAEIGSGGGSLELEGGPKVVFPAGALSEAQEYVLQTTDNTTAFLNEESERPIGPTFVLSPGLASDGAPIEVSLPLTSMPEGFGEPAIGYEYGVGNRVGAEDSQHTRWQYENASYTAGRLVAKVTELSGMRLQFVLTNLEAE